MVTGNDCNYCIVIESYKAVFQRFPDYFPILRKACSLDYFSAALKDDIQFKRNNGLRNVDGEY